MTLTELQSEYGLPIPQRLSEERLERIAERFFNRVDRKLIKTRELTQAEYDKACVAFSTWERRCYDFHG